MSRYLTYSNRRETEQFEVELDSDDEVMILFKRGANYGSIILNLLELVWDFKQRCYFDPTKNHD